MSSVHRIGITIAGFATMATIAGALVVQGYTTAQQAEAQARADALAQSQAQAQVQGQIVPDPTATPVPEIVYINPLPTQPPAGAAPAAPVAPADQPTVIHVVVPWTDDEGSDD